MFTRDDSEITRIVLFSLIGYVIIKGNIFLEVTMTEEKLKELLSSMTVEEKIGQLVQLTGDFFIDEGIATGPMEWLSINEDQVKCTGSILSTVGAKKLKDLQDRYMASNPHHIPLIFMADVINGYRTVFPIPLGQGCTFNPELVEEMASVAAKESARAGIHVTFSPMVDLVRDARWGRVMESTGEDVYLNARMSSAAVKGYQGSSIGDKDKISACIKHFAAYGAPVAGRDYNQVELSERTLKEEYLPAYKAGVDAGARMVMTSFNTLGKLPCTANEDLMKKTLREEWGFDGVLISDWAAIKELVFHSVAENDEEAAYLGIKAGVDIDMVTNVYINNLKKLIDEGRVPMQWLDDCTYRVLAYKNELGLFENPYKDADEDYDGKVDSEHMAFARKAAPESFVLLKNEGMLPLPNKATDDCGSVAFIGPYMNETNICGSWTIFNNNDDNITLEQALKERNPEISYVIEPGCKTLAAGQHFVGFQSKFDNPLTEAEQESMMEKAVKAASEADRVVMAIGEFNQMTGEGASRTEITIPEHQLELFRRVAMVNDNIIVVNFSGRPLDIREINKKAKAILQVWYPGTVAGYAVMDVLFGDAAPSGRLSMSFPYNVGQVPVYYSELHTGRYAEDPENRFTSKYMDAPNDPLFVFGYGLDYTDYEYSNLRISSNTISENSPIKVSVDVKNVGWRDGKEVVQLYIQDMVGSVARPLRQLKAFDKVDIKAGETKTIDFTITTDMLKFYDVNMNYVAEPGEFKVYVGRDSKASLCESFRL